MKSSARNYFLITALCLLMTVPVFAAQHDGSGRTGGDDGSGRTQEINPTIPNPLKGINTLTDLFKAIVNNILIPIGSVIAVIAFIVTGFMFVTAQGKPDKLETAKRALLYTAIGTAILLGASVIITVLTNTIDQIRG